MKRASGSKIGKKRGPYAKDDKIPILPRPADEGIRALELLLLSVIWKHPSPASKSRDDFSDVERLSKAMKILTGRTYRSISALDLEIAADVSHHFSQTKGNLDLDDALRKEVALRMQRDPSDYVHKSGYDNEHADMRRARSALTKSNFLETELELRPTLLKAVMQISKAVTGSNRP